MATESVDDPEELRKQVLTKAFENLSDALADIEYKYPEGGEPGAAISAGKAYAKYFTEVDAYYNRECARKVLEELDDAFRRLEERVEYNRHDIGEAGMFVRVGYVKNFLNDTKAELRAAIEEVGGRDGTKQ